MRPIFTLAAALLPLYANAFSPSGLRFEHQEWDLACDNTGTCRAAGYSAEGATGLPVSVLVTRAAGPAKPPAVQVMLGLEYEEKPAFRTLPEKFSVELKVNGKTYGQVAIFRNSLMGELTAAQANALLASLGRQASIEFGRGRDIWRLSDKGAAAVLLKMDEYQGRIGTPGALLRKGTQPESSVPAASPAPIVTRAAYARPQPGDERFIPANREALRQALRATVKNENCGDLEADGEQAPDLNAQRLSATHMLVWTQCSTGHEPNYGYWIVSHAPPFRPLLVSTEITEASAPESTLQKNRKSTNDHWESRTFSWDGRHFVVTEESVTGTGRSIKAGGGWTLPTIVTTVR